jgi:hypothetical protein
MPAQTRLWRRRVLSVRRRVCHHRDAGGESGDLLQVEMSDVNTVNALKETVAATGDHREHPEVKLIDEIVCQENPVKLTGAILDDVPLVPILDLHDLGRGITVNERAVPAAEGVVGQRPRCHVFGYPVEPLGVRVMGRVLLPVMALLRFSGALGPGSGKALIAFSAQQQRLGGEQHVLCVLVVLVIPVGCAPLVRVVGSIQAERMPTFVSGHCHER